MNTKSIFLVGVLGLALASSQMGCKRLAERVAKKAIEQATGEAGVGGSDSASGDDDNDPRAAALSELIDCLNGNDERVTMSLRAYADWLKTDANGKLLPPTGKERSVRRLTSFIDSQVKSCRDAIKLSQNVPEFKDAANAYGAALDALEPIHERAYKYYDHETWKDDNFAQAKEMHPTLVAAFEQFRAASKGLHAVVEKVNDERQRASLASIEKESGRNLSWHRVNVMLKAKDAMRIAVEDEPALADLELVTNEYEKAVEAMSTYIKANPDEAGKIMMLSMWTSEADDFVKALKGRVRRVRDKKPFNRYDQMEGLTAVEGSPGKVNYEYNELIERSNRLR